MTEKMRAILVALRDGEHTDWNSALAPNSIGYSIGVQPRGGAQYRSRGPGSIIAPCITALERKGFVHHGARPDGLSGSAYYITPAGIAELKQILDTSRQVCYTLSMTKTQKIPAIEVQVGDLIGQTKSDPAPRQVLEIRDHSVARSIWLARTDEEVAQTLAHETRMIEQRFIRQHSTGRELDSLRIQPKFTTKVWVTRTTTDQEA